MAFSAFSAFIQPREWADDGTLLDFGTVAFYLSGTSVLAEIQNSSGNDLPNPVTLNSAGTFSELPYGASVAYKVVIKDKNGVEVYEDDPVYPFGAGGDSSLGTIAVVANYDALRNLSKDYDTVIVNGRTLEGDGGQGVFSKSETSSDLDNDGTILVRASTRPYFRSYDGMVDPRWFGVVYGSSEDQIAALKAAQAVGPAPITGSVTINQDAHITGDLIVYPGGCFATSGNTPKLYLDGKIIQGAAGMFGSGITVVAGSGITELRRSWFATFSQSLCTEYWARYVFDAKETTSSDIIIPSNYAVDVDGSALITISSLVNISIADMRYSGRRQWIKYGSLADIGTVSFGDSPCYLEWFGGVSGTGFGIDNRIPGKAALMSGCVALFDDYYAIKDSGSAWAIAKDLTVIGTDGSQTLELNNAITCGAWKVKYASWTGSGSVTASSDSRIESSTVYDLKDITPPDGVGNVNSGIFSQGTYWGTSAAGKLISSSDLVTWTAVTVFTSETLTNLVIGNVMAVLGESGHIWTTKDGGANWTSQTLGSVTHTRLKYLNGTWILLSSDGSLRTSADGSSWNSPAALNNGASINDIAYSSTLSLYVVVGNSGFAAYSSDLISWTTAGTPSTLTENLMTVATTKSAIVASGALSGTYIRSTDGAAWYQYLLPRNSSIYSSAVGDDNTLALMGTNGYLFKSVDDGVTFVTKTVSANSATYSMAYNAQNWVVGDAAGNVYNSNDLESWSSHATGLNTSISSITIAGSAYALACDGGMLAISSDGVTWSTKTLGTGNLLRIRLVNGIYWVCAASGGLWWSADLLTFTKAKNSTTFDIHDITYSASRATWMIVGSAGGIAYTTTPFSTVNTWTVVTPAVISEPWLICDFRGSSYNLFSANHVAKGTTEASIALATPAVKGMVVAAGATGVTYVRYGDGGYIDSSTDLASFTKRVSGTTSNIVCGCAVNTSSTACASVLLGCADGSILRSTDLGATWSILSISAPGQINSIDYYSGTVSAAGVGTFLSKSTDAGASWTTQAMTFVAYDDQSTPITVTANIMAHWVNSGEESMVMDDGYYYVYNQSLSKWIRMMPPQERTAGALLSGHGGWAVGVNGALQLRYPGASSAYMVSLRNVNPMDATANNVCIVNGVILDGNGRVYSLREGAVELLTSRVVKTPLVNQTLRSLCWDSINSVMYAVGGGCIYSATAATGFENWAKVSVGYSGVNDVEWIASASKYIAVGASGFIAGSVDGISWGWLGDDDETDDYYCSQYAFNGLQNVFAYTGVTTYLSGIRSVIAGESGLIASGTSAQTPAISVSGKVDVYDSAVTVPVTSTAPGNVSASSIKSVSQIAVATDSTMSSFSGALFGGASRCSINFKGAMALSDGASIENCDLVKTAKNRYLPMLSMSSSGTAKVSNSRISCAGLLFSASSTDRILLVSGGYIENGGSVPLTDGGAVYLSSVTDQNGASFASATAASIDGEDVATGVAVYASVTPSASATGWLHPQAANLSSDGTKLTVASGGVFVSQDKTSRYALRYHAANTALSVFAALGGTIKLSVTFPSGFAKQKKARLSAHWYVPQYFGFGWATRTPGACRFCIGASVNAYDNGNVAAYANSTDAGSIVSVNRSWNGQRSLSYIPDVSMIPLYAAQSSVDGIYWQDSRAVCDVYGDEYLSGTYHSGHVTNDGALPAVNDTSVLPSSAKSGYTSFGSVCDGYLVITSEEGVTLPMGTTIKVEVSPSLPETRSAFLKSFNDGDSALGLGQFEKSCFYFGGIESEEVNLTRVVNSDSVFSYDRKFMGVTFAAKGTFVNYYWYPDDYNYSQLVVSSSSHTYDNNNVWLRQHQKFDPASICPALLSVTMKMNIKVIGLRDFSEWTPFNVVGYEAPYQNATHWVASGGIGKYKIEGFSKVKSGTSFSHIKSVTLYDTFDGYEA